MAEPRWVKRFERRFVHPAENRRSLRHTKDRFVFWCALVLSLGQAFYFSTSGDLRRVVVGLCFFAGTAVLVLSLRRLSRMVAGNLLVASALSWLVYVVSTGVSPIPAFFILFTPMIAVMFADIRSALCWTAAVLVLLVVLRVRQHFGLGSSLPIHADWGALVGSYFYDALAALGVFSFFAVYYEGFLVYTLKAAERANDELGLSNERLVILEAKARAETFKAESLLRMGRTLLNTLPLPVFIKDLDMRYIGCTTAYCELVGRSREELLGRRSEDYFAPDLVEAHRLHDDDLFENGGVMRFEASLPVGGGRTLPVEVFKSIVFGYDDKPSGLIGVFIDMSERKADEEKLQSLLQARDRLLAIMSHDLVNPLWGLKQTIELEDRPFTPETAELFADEMERSVGAMHALLENVLGWARLQWHELRINYEDFDIVALAAQESAELGRVPGGRASRVAVPSRRAAIVRGDRNIVRMLLRNLVSNALAYSPPGESVEVRVDDEGEAVRVSVADKGSGMPAEIIEALERGDSMLGSGRRSGHGFGLALCRDLAVEMGSHLSFAGAPGGGTVASFPLRKSASCLERPDVV